MRRGLAPVDFVFEQELRRIELLGLDEISSLPCEVGIGLSVPLGLVVPLQNRVDFRLGDLQTMSISVHSALQKLDQIENGILLRNFEVLRLEEIHHVEGSGLKLGYPRPFFQPGFENPQVPPGLGHVLAATLLAMATQILDDGALGEPETPHLDEIDGLVGP